jgi:membrane peptidoglycan carboxypeptidase
MKIYYLIVGIIFSISAVFIFSIRKYADSTVENNAVRVNNFRHSSNVEVYNALREVAENADVKTLKNILLANGYAECPKPLPIIFLPSKTFCLSGDTFLVKTFSPFKNYTLRLNKNKSTVTSVLDENAVLVEKAEIPFKSFATLNVNKDGEVESVIRNDLFRGKSLVNFLNSDFMQFALYNEDRNFYNHHGTDWGGLMRAVYQTTYNKISRNGKPSQGASTITEQATKRLYTDEERTFTRRIWSMFLADAMEQKYTKQAILDFWLNSSVMGKERPNLTAKQGESAMIREQLIGFQTAAKSLFSKDLTDLSPNEQAVLVCLPRNPEIAPNLKKNNTLNLNNDKHKGLDKRRKEALEQFAEFLEKRGENKKAKLYRDAIKETVQFRFQEDDLIAEETLSFYLRKRNLKDLYKTYAPKNNDEYLTLVTTIDQLFQKDLSVITSSEMLKNKQAIQNHINGNPNFEIQVDIVVMDAVNGNLKAFSSLKTSNGRVVPNRSNINNPSHIASPAKPLHLATAISEGKMTSETLITPNQCFTPDKFQFESERTSDSLMLPMSQHLIYSNNLAFICVGNYVGIDTIEAKWRELFDLPTPTKEEYNKMDGHPYELLRGLNRKEAELSPMQVAEAYTALANKGLKIKINAIQQTFVGSEQIEITKPEQKQVFSTFASNAVTSILQTKAKNEMQNLPDDSILATKTGSSSFSYWFVMYSNKIVVVGRFFIISDAKSKRFLKDVYAKDTIKPFMDNSVLKLIINTRPKWLK